MSSTKWGYIDRNGQEAIPFKFDWASTFIEDRAVAAIGDKYGYLDKTGHWVISPIYGADTSSFSDGTAVVELASGKLGIINRHGAPIVSAEFDYAEPFSDGYALVENEGLQAFINPEGRELFSGFYQAESFCCGFAPVLLDDGWHYLDGNGNISLGPLDRAGRFRDGFAVTQSGRDNYFLGRDGCARRILEVVDFVSPYCSERRFAFQRNKMEGFLNENGDVIIPARFDEVSQFSEGLSTVCVDDLWGVIDLQGEWIVKPTFESTGIFLDGFCRVTHNGKEAYMSRDGKLAIQPNAEILGEFGEGLAPIGIAKLST